MARAFPLIGTPLRTKFADSDRASFSKKNPRKIWMDTARLDNREKVGYVNGTSRFGIRLDVTLTGSPGAGQMSWHRITFLLLLVACWLVPPRVGSHPARRPGGFPAFRRMATDPRPDAHLASCPRQSYLIAFSPRRFRMKSVRVDGNPRISRGADLGPATSPDLPIPSVRTRRSAAPFGLILPMRC